MGLAHSTLFTHFVFNLQPVESSILVTDSCRCCIKYCVFNTKNAIKNANKFHFIIQTSSDIKMERWKFQSHFINHYLKFIFRILRGTECESYFQKSIYLHQIFCNQIPYIVKTGRWNLIFREKLNSKSTTMSDFFSRLGNVLYELCWCVK